MIEERKQLLQFDEQNAESVTAQGGSEMKRGSISPGKGFGECYAPDAVLPAGDVAGRTGKVDENTALALDSIGTCRLETPAELSDSFTIDDSSEVIIYPELTDYFADYDRPQKVVQLVHAGLLATIGVLYSLSLVQ